MRSVLLIIAALMILPFVKESDSLSTAAKDGSVIERNGIRYSDRNHNRITGNRARVGGVHTAIAPVDDEAHFGPWGRRTADPEPSGMRIHDYRPTRTL